MPKVSDIHAVDNINSDYNETTQYFLELDEKINNILEPSIEELNKVKEIRSWKKIIKGPSEEIFLTLSHTLYVYSNLIKHLLSKKELEYILIGRSNNDPIEKQFSLNRYLSGNHLALDVSSFVYNERTLFINVLSGLYHNPNNSYNNEKYNIFLRMFSQYQNSLIE